MFVRLTCCLCCLFGWYLCATVYVDMFVSVTCCSVDMFRLLASGDMFMLFVFGCQCSAILSVAVVSVVFCSVVIDLLLWFG